MEGMKGRQIFKDKNESGGLEKLIKIIGERDLMRAVDLDLGGVR